jgi:hypothetical protein
MEAILFSEAFMGVPVYQTTRCLTIVTAGGTSNHPYVLIVEALFGTSSNIVARPVWYDSGMSGRIAVEYNYVHLKKRPVSLPFRIQIRTSVSSKTYKT